MVKLAGCRQSPRQRVLLLAQRRHPWPSRQPSAVRYRAGRCVFLPAGANRPKISRTLKWLSRRSECGWRQRRHSAACAKWCL